MANVLEWTNNAASTLAAPVNTTQTTINISAGGGALFPNPGVGQYFVATITDAATGLINEIIWVTGNTGDIFTVQRAQEGTTAKNWNAGDNISNLLTAGQLAQFVQISQIGAQLVFSATDGGAVNSMVITTVQPLTTLTDGDIVEVTPAFTNTSKTVTANINSLGSLPVLSSAGNPLLPGDLLGTAKALLLYNAAVPCLNLVPQAPQLQFKGIATPTITASGTTTLNLSHIGAALTFDGTTAQVAVLPDHTDTAIKIGSTVQLTNTGTNPLTVNASAAASVINVAGAAPVATFTMNIGENALLTWDGSFWVATGTFMARYVAMTLGQSLTTNGYQKLPGGLIMQWGSSTTPIPVEENITITFPIAFPAQCFAICMTSRNNNSSTDKNTWFQIVTLSASNAVMWNQGAPNTPSDDTDGYAYIAIGF